MADIDARNFNEVIRILQELGILDAGMDKYHHLSLKMNDINTDGKEILAETNAVDDNHATHKDEKCNISRLADATCIPDNLLRAYISGGKRPGLLQVMRIIAVLGPTRERAEHIIHTAGYDISTDGQPENADYRAIVDLGAGHTDSKNEILMRHGQYIGRAFVRY